MQKQAQDRCLRWGSLSAERFGGELRNIPHCLFRLFAGGGPKTVRSSPNADTRWDFGGSEGLPREARAPIRSWPSDRPEERWGSRSPLLGVGAVNSDRLGLGDGHLVAPASGASAQVSGTLARLTLIFQAFPARAGWCSRAQQYVSHIAYPTAPKINPPFRYTQLGAVVIFVTFSSAS